MKTYVFKALLQNKGWLENASVTVDANGKITDVSEYDKKNGAVEHIDGAAVPGFQNAHSHAFQYAMAGIAERHRQSGKQDDFWGWREAMYQLALSIDPDQMQAIASMLYSEMLRHGYTNVVEFQYVHHDKNGKPYSNRAEMGSRLVEAAKTAGIGITLVPIYYQKGGFGQAPNPRQRRFISATNDDYLKLLEASVKATKDYQHANIGIGIHSLRGVEPADIVRIADSGPQDMPFHIHVSEQLKEIDDAIGYLGKRPVEWLLDTLRLNDRFHLVHATHMTIDETIRLAKSKAHVVLCPSTEGNLGDGLFPLRKFQEAGGKWSIGTDSHIGLNPLEELRILDYGQRLHTHKRNTFTFFAAGDSGFYALHMATISGRKAMGDSCENFFQIGAPLNASLFNLSHPLLASTSMKNMASTLVYAADNSMQIGTISHGKLHQFTNQDIKTSQIHNNFTKVLSDLKNR